MQAPRKSKSHAIANERGPSKLSFKEKGSQGDASDARSKEIHQRSLGDGLDINDQIAVDSTPNDMEIDAQAQAAAAVSTPRTCTTTTDETEATAAEYMKGSWLLRFCSEELQPYSTKALRNWRCIGFLCGV